VVADRLLVTITTTGGVGLTTDLLRETPPEPDELEQAARDRIDRYLNARPDPLRSTHEAGASPSRAAAPADTPSGETPPVPGAPGVEGVLGFHAGRVVLEPDPGGGQILSLLGGVQLVYQSDDGSRVVTLEAQRIVVFLAPADETADDGGGGGAGGFASSLAASRVRGVYLEKRVIVRDGRFTVRAPQAFYDLATDRALVPDAVLYTWDVDRRIPLYVRAEVLRQEAERRWSARRVHVTTSEFAEPHFAIAASRVVVEAGPTERDPVRYTASTARFEVQGVPVFALPRLAGEVRRAPLRSLSVGTTSEGDGGINAVIRSTWDLFAVFGETPPENTDLSLALGYLGEHGLELGLDLEYDQPTMSGDLRGVVLPHDTGDDEIADRRPIDQGGRVRGRFAGRHRQVLRDDWELIVQVDAVSDPTLLEELYSSEAVGVADEASIYMKQIGRRTSFTALATTRVNDFTPQTNVLQTPGYSVERLPEFNFYVSGLPLWGDRLTYFNRTEFSRLRLLAGDDTPRARGFSASQSMAAFGIADPTTSFEEALLAMGMPDDARLRFDSRHELTAPLSLGPMDVMPFAAGRITVYSADFADLGADDKVRLWGQLGVHVATDFSRTYGDVSNRFLDLHRLRHLVRPSLTLTAAGETTDSDALPVFAPEVERLDAGLAARFGLRQVWQTQRGGPGRWRGVDWIVWDTALVLRGGEASDGMSLPRYFTSRPELGAGGDFAHSALRWAVTDALAGVGDATYDLDAGRLAQWRMGARLIHRDRLESHLALRGVEAVDSRFIEHQVTYELTRKYTAFARHTWDLDGGGLEDVQLLVQRKLPRWLLIVRVGYDNIDDEFDAGILLAPQGLLRTLAPGVFREDD